MIKKICCFLCCTVILVLSCSIAFLSSAVVPDVYLPFPEPLEFGGPYSGSVVFHGVNSSNVEIYYMVTVVPNLYCANGYSGGCNWNFTGTANSFKIDFATNANIVAGVNVYVFSWKPTSSTYNCSLKTAFVMNPSQTKSYSVFSNSSYTFDNFMPYGQSVGSSFSDTSIKPSYIFSGEVSQNDIDTIVANCNGIKTDLDSINSATQNIQTYAFNIANSNSAISSKLDSTNSWLSMIETDITIYSNEIIDKLNKLLDLQGYQEPPETTKNSSINSFNEQFNSVGSSQFDTLNNFSVPDFKDNNTNPLNSMGSNFLNSLSFLSSNMEFFSGNGESYNTDSNSTLTNTMRKISTLIFIVLMIGIISFVLNIVSSKGSD